jgi:hypothetical protein
MTGFESAASCSQIIPDCYRHNFSRRIWKPVVEKLVKDGLVREYLPFYDIRRVNEILVGRQKIRFKESGVVELWSCGEYFRFSIFSHIRI